MRYGTLPFSAPEVFTAELQDPRALDVWAFGITMYLYLQDTFPFDKGAEVQEAIKNTNFGA